ncbi:MAG TPA: hypothetical protein PK228_21415 [Saprospiraceae bacterium]|nr:hypothetical protein [Saprospiraceae bacterium]
MKGTFVKQIQRSLVAVLLVIGALAFSTSRADAQVTNLNHNWVTESEAITALENAVQLWAADQGNYSQGSTPWVNAANHIEFYKQLRLTIEGGTSVPVAVVSTSVPGYNPAPTGSLTTTITITQAQMDQLRNDATDLLTQ